MAVKFVNLDALLPREDFEVIATDEQVPSQLGDTLPLADLEPGRFTYAALRKPDFQRETSNWSPQHIVDFVKSFVEGDLIPAVILWQSPTNNSLFAIDGAHRLSALIAWVRDDYGDGDISRKFYENRIRPEQLEAAEDTRWLIKSQLGSFKDFQSAVLYPDNSDPALVRRAKRLGAVALPLQWVRGDAKKAEQSFLRINQKATSIDPTEMQIIENRNKPNAISARAIVRAGVGHKFWSGFTTENRLETEQLAKAIHTLFFEPPIKTPVKTIDLPMAGQGYSPAALRLVYEFVNTVNDSRTLTSTKKLPDDTSGTDTVNFLRESKKLAVLLSSNEPCSLGLHPAVYFYGSTGAYVPSAFLATLQFVKELRDTNKLMKFTSVRAQFEDFLVENKHFINVIVSEKGSGFRAVPFVTKMYKTIFAELLQAHDSGQILRALHQQGLNFLEPMTGEGGGTGAFSSAAKSAAVLSNALTNALRCGECGARVHHERAITIDHKVRKEDGGSSHSSNALLMHPYCNSGVKEKRVAQQTGTD